MDELPWVQAGDNLFRSDADWQTNACLNYGGGWWLYGTGFYQGARALVERVMEDQQGQDLLIYPIVFNYRQYIEIRLKEGIREGEVLMNGNALPQKALKDLLHQHALTPLWKRYVEILRSQWPDSPPEDFDAAESLIYQFDAVDPGSSSFRFPTTKTGAPSLPPDLKLVNIRNLGDVMERLASFLDATGQAIGHRVEQTLEMRWALQAVQPTGV